jgi:hypothetical protein
MEAEYDIMLGSYILVHLEEGLTVSGHGVNGREDFYFFIPTIYPDLTLKARATIALTEA